MHTRIFSTSRWQLRLVASQRAAMYRAGQSLSTFFLGQGASPCSRSATRVLRSPTLVFQARLPRSGEKVFTSFGAPPHRQLSLQAGVPVSWLKLTLTFLELVERFGDVDGSRIVRLLLGNPPGDPWRIPQVGVGGELVAAGGVELLTPRTRPIVLLDQ